MKYKCALCCSWSISERSIRKFGFGDEEGGGRGKEKGDGGGWR